MTRDDTMTRRVERERITRSAAAAIAGACWDDRADIGTLPEQLRSCAATPSLGSDGDLSDEDRHRLLDLAAALERERA